MNRTGRLWIELILVYFIAPIGVLFVQPRMLLSILWAVTALALIPLFRDPTFDRKRLWNAGAMKHHWLPIVGRFALLAPMIVLATWQLTPELFLGFPKSAPGMWAAVVCLYPIFSVYPQGIVYRGLLLHRYGPLFPGMFARIAMAGFAFGYLHLVFANWQAPALTLIGGIFFARTYEKSRSLFVAAVEHALYGCWIITTGWGWYVYSGSRAAVEQLNAG